MLVLEVVYKPIRPWLTADLSRKLLIGLINLGKKLADPFFFDRTEGDSNFAGA